MEQHILNAGVNVWTKDSYSKLYPWHPKSSCFDANKCYIIKKLSALLQIFHKTTVSLSERSSTASNIILHIKFLMLYITKASTNAQFSGLGSMLTSLKASANARFSKYLSNSNIILATFLDPRYKGNLFLKRQWWSIWNCSGKHSEGGGNLWEATAGCAGRERDARRRGSWCF